MSEVPPDDVECPACHKLTARRFPIFHHMVCAYVGPSYDFPLEGTDYECPKCRRHLTPDGDDWEIVGDCLRCETCGEEIHL